MLNVSDGRLADIHSKGDSNLLSQLQPPGIDVGDHHVPGSGQADDRSSHDANRSRAGDQDIFTKHGERQCGMDSVAEGVEYRCHVAIDVLLVMPDIGHRQDQLLGKRTRPINANPLRVRTQVAATCQAVTAAAADDMPFATDHVAGMEIGDIVADLDNRTYELMANNQRHRDRLTGPLVPVVDV